MPTFALEANNIIKIGTNNLTMIEIYPFSSIQNAKFLMRAFDENNTVPNWVQVNNNNMTVSILRNKIISVSNIKLNFEAQLITTQYPDDNYLKYTTQGSFSYFYFENSN